MLMQKAGRNVQTSAKRVRKEKIKSGLHHGGIIADYEGVKGCDAITSLDGVISGCLLKAYPSSIMPAAPCLRQGTTNFTKGNL